MTRKITAILCALCLLSLAACGTGNQAGSPATGNSTAANSSAGNTSTGSASVKNQSSQNQSGIIETDQLQPPEKGQTIAVIKTSLGNIKVKFFPKEAPKAVENFIGLSNNGYYNNLTFHRVMKEFMIQGGDPNGDGTGGQSIWGKEFEDEFSPKLHNFRGALCMANAGPNTNGSQFFIVQATQIAPEGKPWMEQNGFDSKLIDQYMKLGGAPWLDNLHTVFGEVFEGMDVVDKIAGVDVDPESSKPLTPVTISGVEITTQK